MTRSRTRQEDPLKGFRFEPEFVPHHEVVETWRQLSGEQTALEQRLFLLKREGLHVFPRVVEQRSSETGLKTGSYYVADYRRMIHLVTQFSQGAGKIRGLVESVLLGNIDSSIENVFQHADRREPYQGAERGITTPEPYALCLVVADMRPLHYFDYYVMDNGMGFVNPKTLRRTLPASFREGVSMSHRGRSGYGLWATVEDSHEVVIVSADRMYAKHRKEAPMRKVQQPPFRIRYVPGALVAARIYHPQELNRQEDHYRKEHHLPARQEP